MIEELLSFEPDSFYSAETEAKNRGIYLAGMDEAGRGPLMGPVVVASVIISYDDLIEGINDSKKLTEKKRDMLYEKIIEKAVSYGVGIIDNKRIDEIGIGDAVREAFTMAADNLKIRPDIIFNDEVKWTYGKIPNKSFIKGDARIYSISAASIIAKVTRDRMVYEMDKLYPEYGFAKHKGYGTKAHYEAIEKYGICPLHRVSYFTNKHSDLLKKPINIK